MNMKITYDPYADAMYIFAGKIFKSASTISVQPDVLVDLDNKKRLVGIEILDISKKLPRKELRTVNLELNLEPPKQALQSGKS